MKLDLHNLALQFVREHKFSMPVQDVEEAMKMGAEEAACRITELLKESRIEMEKFRDRNNAPR